jgi:hypothetical protein
MADIRFYKTTALPASPVPNSVYFVKPTIASELAALYITDINGVPKPLVNNVTDLSDPNDVDTPTTLAVSNAITEATEWQTTDEFFDA